MTRMARGRSRRPRVTGTALAGPRRSEGGTATRSDQTIRQQIEVRIAASSLAGSPIDVDVRHGHVVLRGAVPGPAARHMAEQIAESVGGVQRVTNELCVPARDDRSGRRAS